MHAGLSALHRRFKWRAAIGRYIGAWLAPRTGRIQASSEALAPDEQPLRYISVQPAFRRFIDKVPKEVETAPSMISIAEKRLLFGLAEKYCAGAGIIVDAGIFLGASTLCFGEGLRRNKNLERLRALRDSPIISFEKGDITPTMSTFLRENYPDLQSSVGSNFIETTKMNIREVADLVELRIGDILLDPLDIDCPIEVCFLDILKRPSISLHCFNRFLPLLIPGRSIVLHQDYFYEKLPYIKTHQEYLRDYFDYVGEVGSTAIFRLASPVPPEKLVALAHVGAEEQLMLAGLAARRSRDPYRRLMMSLSRLRLVAKLRGRQEAVRQLAALRTEYSDQIGRAPLRIVEALAEIEELCRPRT